MDHYSNLFTSSDNQFGFKKKSGCAHAIYVFRCVIDRYVNSGSTVNVYAIDVSKAFDKINHYGLFITLMKRRIPDNLLSLLESWFSTWHNVWSRWFRLSCGIRQGWVLSPYLFAIYIDSLVEKVQACGYGCYLRRTCISIILYADALLLAPSVSSLQLIFSVCEKELHRLDMMINVKKSLCLRIGPRHNAKCSNIIASDSHHHFWRK